MNRHSHKIDSSKKSFIDKLIYTAVISSPIFTFPQVVDIYSSKSAQDVSLITWSAYTYGSFLWLLYGIKHREIPLILLNSIICTLDIVIVVGILLYS